MTTQGRTQAYSAGNKVYGFGRSNPTSGPVDKLGYRERDLMQQAIARAIAPKPVAKPAPPPPKPVAAPPKPVAAAPRPVAAPAPVVHAASPTGAMAPAVPAGQRAMTSFDAGSQAKLQSGAIVTGGDGRQFQMINGHATDINSAAGVSGLAQRAANTAAAQPAPVQHSVAPAVDYRAPAPQQQMASPAPAKNSWMQASQGSQAQPYMDPAGPPGMNVGGIPLYSQPNAPGQEDAGYDFNGQMMYTHSGQQQGGQGPGTTAEQQQLLASMSDPYLAQSYKDKALQDYQGHVNYGVADASNPNGFQNAQQEQMWNAQMASSGSAGAGPITDPNNPNYHTDRDPYVKYSLIADQIRPGMTDQQMAALQGQYNNQHVSPEQSSQGLGFGAPGNQQAAPAYQQQTMPGFAQKQHDIESQTYEAQRGIQDAAPQQYQQLLEQFAGHGLAHSGRYETEYGAAHDATAQQIAALDRLKAQQLAGLQQDNLGYNQQAQQAQQDQFMQQLQSQISGAGSLGLDLQTQDPQAADYSQMLQQLMNNYGGVGSQIGDPAASFAPSGPAPVIPSSPAPSAAAQPAVYSAMQRALMAKNHIAPGSMTPEQVHQLGVATHFTGTPAKPAPKPAPKPVVKYVAPKPVAKKVTTPVKKKK